MSDVFIYLPQRRTGIFILFGSILLLVGVGAYNLWQAMGSAGGTGFLVFLAPVLIVAGIVPWLVYRLYALYQSGYLLEREGVRLRWGLRSEDLPMDEITWVGAEHSLPYRIPKPIFAIPGAVLGERILPDGKPIEFLASRRQDLIVIITLHKAYAISPVDNEAFLSTYQRLVELGSLASIPPRAAYATVLFTRSWSNLSARILLSVGMVLVAGLFVWIALLVPGYQQLPIRLTPQGTALEFVPAIRILLLPMINGFFFLVDSLLGLFFYRRQELRPLAYVLWGTSIFTSLLFYSAVFFLWRAG